MKRLNKNTYNKPIVEIVFIQHQSVICQSGVTQNFNEGNTNDWY